MTSRAKLPLVVVIVVLAVATVGTAIVQLSERQALTPWEAAVAMEAMRLNTGLPLYEAGHATHMYGPLLTVLYAAVFRIFGLNLLAARMLMSLLAFALAIFLSTLLCRGKGFGQWLLAALLFLAIDLRTNLILLSAHPDGVAALGGLAAIYLWITRRGSSLRTAGSIVLFLCAMLVKQTSAAFALIPVVHILYWERPLRFRALLSSLIPTLSLLLGFAVIRAVWPSMFSAIVTVPASYKVYPDRALRLTLYLFATFPIFLIGALPRLRSTSAMTESERWIWSSIIVMIPVSISAASKGGGSYNSLLPAYLAMTALFVMRLDAMAEWLRSLPIQRSLVAASAIALAVFFSFFYQSDRAIALMTVRCGDEKYESAVVVARRIGAGVISPQDPTIAYRANGHFGHSLFFELDAHPENGNWPAQLPGSMLDELTQAKQVIEVRSYVPTPVFASALAHAGFHQVSISELENSAYTMWSKQDN